MSVVVGNFFYEAYINLWESICVVPGVELRVFKFIQCIPERVVIGWNKFASGCTIMLAVLFFPSLADHLADYDDRFFFNFVLSHLSLGLVVLMLAIACFQAAICALDTPDGAVDDPFSVNLILSPLPAIGGFVTLGAASFIFESNEVAVLNMLWVALVILLSFGNVALFRFIVHGQGPVLRFGCFLVMSSAFYWYTIVFLQLIAGSVR